MRVSVGKLLLVSSATVGTLVTAQTVDLSSQKGAPQHFASGFIYGIPDTFGQIPSHWYANIGFNYGRAGGAQEGPPNGGWVRGLSNYQGRLQSTLTDYKTCRQFNASFILLPHDVWGTDQASSSTKWPGDNGDWTDYDNFVKQLMSDLKANNALEGLVWDVWNEPDGSWFWARSMQQWIDLYIRTHKAIRADSAFDGVKISGPSLAAAPWSSSSWWTSWLQQIAAAKTIPDQISYHLEAGPDTASYDLTNTYPSVKSMLQQHGLPDIPQIINEYAAYSLQIPAGAAFWISRLERFDVYGLRGNWQSGNMLHDLMANLLTKSNPNNYAATDYEMAPEYPVYQYYYQNMTGVRVATTTSSNLDYDCYATVDATSRTVRILAGTQAHTGNWAISVQKLSSVGLPSSGSVNVRTLAFNGNGHFTAVSGPVDQGTKSISYSNDVLTIPVSQTDNYTAYAFEFASGGSTPPGTTTGSTSSTSSTSSTTTPPGTSTSATSTQTAPGAGQTHWGQCGGNGWTGPTSCQSPYTCQVQNPWYSQCL